jgi:hypothetical protein
MASAAILSYKHLHISPFSIKKRKGQHLQTFLLYLEHLSLSLETRKSKHSTNRKTRYINANSVREVLIGQRVLERSK